MLTLPFRNYSSTIHSLPKVSILIVGIVGYIILLIPYWCGFDCHKLVHSPLKDSLTSIKYGKVVLAFLVATLPLLIDTLLDFFQRFSSKKTNTYVLGRFIYAIVCFICSLQLVVISIHPDILMFTRNPVVSYVLIIFGLRIGTTCSLMYILSCVSPSICGVILPLLITLYVTITNCIRFYYLSIYDRPFTSYLILSIVFFILLFLICIYWIKLLYHKRKSWILYDYATIMYISVYVLTYGGSFIITIKRIINKDLYSDITTYTIFDVSITIIMFITSTIIMTIVPGRIARLEAANNLKSIIETKKSYVRYISHELRTPINTIFMGINLCIDDEDEVLPECNYGNSNNSNNNINNDNINNDSANNSPSPTKNLSQRQDILKDTNVACYAALDILNDLLLYDKVENDMMVLNKTDVSISDLIHDSFKMFNVQFRQKNIDLIIDNGKEAYLSLISYVSVIKNEEERLSRILLNSDLQDDIDRSFRVSTDNDVTVIHEDDTLFLDKAKMIQVVRNLISNAVKFTPEGGQILVNMRYVDIDDVGSSIPSFTSIHITNNNYSCIYILGVTYAYFTLNMTVLVQLTVATISTYLMYAYSSIIPFKHTNATKDVEMHDDNNYRLTSYTMQADRNTNHTNQTHTQAHTQPTGYFVLTIKDTGVGISKENQALLFHNIVQFKPEILQHGGGSGLGLYISKNIVDKHDGMITVESLGEGQGTTFTIKIPMIRKLNHVDHTVLSDRYSLLSNRPSSRIFKPSNDIYMKSTHSRDISPDHSSYSSHEEGRDTTTLSFSTSSPSPQRLHEGVLTQVHSGRGYTVSQPSPIRNHRILIEDQIHDNEMNNTTEWDTKSNEDNDTQHTHEGFHPISIVPTTTTNTSEVQTYPMNIRIMGTDDYHLDELHSNYSIPDDSKSSISKDTYQHNTSQKTISTRYSLLLAPSSNTTSYSNIEYEETTTPLYNIHDTDQQQQQQQQQQQMHSIDVTTPPHPHNIPLPPLNTTTTTTATTAATSTNNSANVTTSVGLRSPYRATARTNESRLQIETNMLYQTTTTNLNDNIMDQNIATTTTPTTATATTTTVSATTASNTAFTVKKDATLADTNTSDIKSTSILGSVNPSSTSTPPTSPSTTTTAAAATAAMKPPKLHFLVVDDSSLNRKMICRVLNSCHYTYIEACDGVEAVNIMTEYIQSIPSPNSVTASDSGATGRLSPSGMSPHTTLNTMQLIDVILMDFMMPNMDGPTATSEIRKLGYTGPIYGVTGNAQQFDIDHFIQQGVNKVFTKPLITTEFMKELKQVFHF